MKLKQKDIKILREQLVSAQNHTCALCCEYLAKEDAVLDHRHSDGKIRQAIHRGCNLYLGKLENNIKRNKITPSMLHNILKNAEQYMQTTRDEIHPTYFTPEEKKAKRKKKTP